MVVLDMFKPIFYLKRFFDIGIKCLIKGVDEWAFEELLGGACEEGLSGGW